MPSKTKGYERFLPEPIHKNITLTGRRPYRKQTIIQGPKMRKWTARQTNQHYEKYKTKTDNAYVISSASHPAEESRE